MADPVEPRQGDIFWVDLGEPEGSAPGFRRPVVIIQNDLSNRTAIRTVLACSLSTNVRLAVMPGNVALDAGEGGLPQQSVVVVSQVTTIDRRLLDDLLGALSRRRVRQIIAGVASFIEPTP